MKHTLILLIAFFWGHWAFAELPQSLDEVLFGISGGTNYVKWMGTDGTLKFDRPFAIFDKAKFRMHYPTNDFAPRHYSIEMEREFPDESSSTNLVDLIQKAESILLKSFKGRSFKRQYDGSRYQSSCVDIDGLGWDAWFYVVPMTGISNTFYVARSRFYNSLHREGRFISCEDFECDNNSGTHIVNVTVPMPTMTCVVARISRDKLFVAKPVIAKGVDLAKYVPDQKAVAMVAQSDVYLSLGLPFEDTLCKRALQMNSALKIFSVTNGCYTIDKNIYVWLTPDNMITIAANVRRCLLPENKFFSWSCMSLKDQYKNLGLTVAIAHPALEYPCRYFGLRFVRIYDGAGLFKREELKRKIRDSNAVIILAVECQVDELSLVVPQGIEVGAIDIFEESALVQFTKLIHRAAVIYTDRELENTGDNNCEHR